MPQNETSQVFPLYRIVAQFGNGERRTFDGLTAEQARQAMEDHAAAIGEDIVWYDGVTDENYENGKYHAAIPPPPLFPFPLAETPENPDQLTLLDPPE